MLSSVVAVLTVGCSFVARSVGHLAQSGFKPTGPMTSSLRSVPTFDKVDAGQSYEVDIRFGPTPSVTIEAPKDLLPHLTTSVSGGTLKLGADTSYSLDNRNAVKAHIVVTHLTGVSASGASRMVIKDPIAETSFVATAAGASNLSLSANVDSFKLEIDGAARASINRLKAQTLDIKASGASNCDISGSASKGQIESEGASTISGKGLSIDKASITGNGASTTEIRVTADLKANATGASTIRYLGNPKASRDTAGSSSITQIN